MKRISGISTVGRAINSGGGGGGAASQRRILQTALYTTGVNTTETSRWSWHHGISNSSTLFKHRAADGVAGTKLFSVAASSLAEEAYAKEVPNQSFPKDVVLYQYEACPFCNKVKAFLDYHNIPYEIVEVNPISKKEIKWSDYKKVPILMVDGEQMVDSSDIIDKLFLRIGHEPSELESDEEKQWRGWVDNHLVHVLVPNIYRTASEAIESFDYITTHGKFSLTERIIAKYSGAAAMYFVSKKLKKRHNIVDERAALYGAAETWVGALKGRDFLGGLKPNLADLAVFGVLRPIRYLKSGRDMVEHTRIGDWYSRMESNVKKSSTN